jgi:hypothetical protein
VLTEACFHLVHAAQRECLLRFIVDFSVSAPRSEDETGVWREVFAWLARYAEHAPGWTDGYLAVLSSIERRARVWTYDREFRTTWRRLDGTRIPLAAA